MQKNEGKVCDAVVKILEKRTGLDRTDISYPEKDGVGPPVDLRFKLGTRGYAIEHTQIEAFKDQIDTGEKFSWFIDPVANELSGALPGPAIYYLYFPTDARLGVPANQLDKFRSDFIEWVREHAQRLHEMNPDRPTREQNPHGINEQHRERPPGFPYEVILRREAHWSLSPKHDGVLLVSRFAPNDVEAQRAARLQRTLERKCPKLQHCKEDGAITVLVLEDADIALSNYAIIGEALDGLMEGRANLPDEIYLVETSLDRWDVRLMKHDEKIWPEGAWTEFNSAELTDITGAGAHYLLK